ncbi:uncharacterized protein TEOVI_000161200 [Trypanosoma equiperdum]|uniref:Uncharacterized protein n=2 Tax=Trypanozoon TaxID=39700 RepID=Q385U6_TRYB2|nr:hypothetical protein, conserved [Trypanosoma brucei brucei TREU927]EAN79435.1 hypothetical protein, conserved [Trypanosoma brucei brucei TREU927]SCU70043.1 hypothetical protein, conserved [Trypanosoma equiperdum]
MPRQTTLSVVCLSTGRGASMVYEGNCSTAYVLCVGDAPVVLFGIGYGVTRQCLRYFGTIPTNIAVFSNRSHMSAELPVVIAVEGRKGRHPRIVASETVMMRLMQHRLAEMHSRAAFGVPGEGGVCDFVNLQTDESSPTVPYRLPDFPSVSLVAFDAVSSLESSCGFVVLHHGSPVLALTGDCAYDAQRYQEVLRMAPVVIVDGRKKGSPDHASFADITRAVDDCRSNGGGPRRVFIGQYGAPADAPPVVSGATVLPIVEGAVVELSEGVCIGDAEELLVPPAPSAIDMCESTKTVCCDRSEGEEAPSSFVMRMAHTGGGGGQDALHEGSSCRRGRGAGIGDWQCGGKEAVIVPEANLGSIGVSAAFEEYMQRAYCALQRYPTQEGGVSGVVQMRSNNTNAPRGPNEAPPSRAQSAEVPNRPRGEESTKHTTGYTCRFTALKT